MNPRLRDEALIALLNRNPTMRSNTDLNLTSALHDAGYLLPVDDIVELAEQMSADHLGHFMVRSSGLRNTPDEVRFSLNERGLRAAEAAFVSAKPITLAQKVSRLPWTAIGALAAIVAAISSVILLFES